MTNPNLKVISIDAWAGDEPRSWDWNAWYDAGEVAVDISAPPQTVLRKMQAAGFIRSAKLCAVEDDTYNLVIVDRRTREPLFAIVYGDSI